MILPKLLKQKLPLSALHQHTIVSHRKTVCNLLSKNDPRLALVFGPCSIHDRESALEYAQKFKQLAHRVAKECFCVMRVYIEKPRTTLGWKGFVYDPDLDGSNDLQQGIIEARQLFLNLIDLDIPIATEILNPLLIPFFSDLISWGFIGARTCSSQTHRELASMLTFPIGFKNSPEGSLSQPIHSIIAARESQSFPMMSDQGELISMETTGNPWGHLVLRGSRLAPNYDALSVQLVQEKMKRYQLHHDVMIDCSHDNSKKNVKKQREIFFEVLENYMTKKHPLLGIMLESHLEEGSQRLTEDPSHLQYGVSITDPCMSWKETEEIVLYASEALSSTVMR
ncbi:MAG: 3-deoxy-7-phosphoheptulonate synthase [Candidatus Rhabdochlamydia sp.]